MARSERTGKRKVRSCSTRVPDLGYYLVVTDAEKTEENYLMGLRNSLPKELQERIVIKVFPTKTENLVEICVELAAYHPQFCEPWIVLDRDRVPNFDELIREAEQSKISVGWSNPCIEIWFFAYYGSMPAITESTVCCQRFSEQFQRKTGREYKKSDGKIYSALIQSGDEENALSIAERRLQSWMDCEKSPSAMCPCTTIHRLVGEIRAKSQDIGRQGA